MDVANYGHHTSVRNPVIHLDSELIMKTRILKAVISCCYQFHKVCQVHCLVGREIAQQLVTAFILSQLDYCNLLLSHHLWSTIHLLQRAMKATLHDISWISQFTTM